MRVVFAGTPAFAERALAALLDAGHVIPLVLTQPDRSAGRGMHPAKSPVKRLAVARGLTVFQPVTLRDATSVQAIRASRPDVLVVAAYGLILPVAVLELAPLGALNIHASLLPLWRGAAPIQRALLAGDPETGVSIMRMEEGLDTGPVFVRHAIAIDERDTAGRLHDKLADIGAEMIVGALRELGAGRAQFIPQPAEGVSYARKIGKHEAHVDWHRTSAELDRLVRAFHPAPGAVTTVGRIAFKVWSARPGNGRGAPGEVLRADRGGLLVACGEGALELIELQRAGGRRLAAAEFLRGNPIALGARLGAA
ncbi:MAG: methionyl-tRNA formyltransferase [Betaproteobacteria bacterium]|nr:methionyl-tRNA formyltransferase [Betaproteobacteria bacterium]